MPARSSACHTCKIRRIKCDEAKPRCQRCTKSQRSCFDTAIVQQSSFTVHLENQYASGRMKRPRGPRSSLTTQTAFGIEVRAVAYFLQHHLQPLPDVPGISGCLSNCVASWQSSGNLSYMVDLAISCVALAVHARTQQSCGAAMEASTRYGELLRLAQERITGVTTSTFGEADFIACLLTTTLMSRYEGITHLPGDLPFTSLPAWAHHEGSMAILRAWSETAVGNVPLAVKATRRGLLRSAILRTRQLPQWIVDGYRFGERDLELQYDRIVVRIINLRHTFMNMPTCMDEAERNETVVMLTEEARKIDTQLRAWSSSFPSTYHYRAHVLKDNGKFPRPRFYSPRVFSFSDVAHAALFTQYYATRILINATWSRLLQLASRTQPVDDANVQQQLRTAANIGAFTAGLAGSVPFCLERFHAIDSPLPDEEPILVLTSDPEIKPHLANFVVWPLSIVSSLKEVDGDTQRWFRAELAELGRITGDGILRCAESEQWAFL